MFKCANCARRVDQHECSGDSGLYNHGDGIKYNLCEECFLEEDAMIDETGTNDHPSRRERYSINQPGGY
jgi:hypothetical protein